MLVSAEFQKEKCLFNSSSKELSKSLFFKTIVSYNYNRHFFSFLKIFSCTQQDFVNLWKKCTAKPHSFLVIDTALASDSHLHFRKNLSERT